MIKVLFLWTLASAVLSSCVVLPHNEPDIASSVRSLYGQCPPKTVSFIFYEMMNETTGREKAVEPDENNRGSIKWPSYYILKEFSESNFFKKGKGEEVTYNYIVESHFYLYTTANVFQKIWSWGNMLTLGLLPSWGSGKIRIEIKVMDRNANLIKSFEEESDSFNILNGLIFFPFDFIHSNTIASLEAKVVPVLVRKVLRNMEVSGIVCSNRKL